MRTEQSVNLCGEQSSGAEGFARACVKVRRNVGRKYKYIPRPKGRRIRNMVKGAAPFGLRPHQFLGQILIVNLGSSPTIALRQG